MIVTVLLQVVSAFVEEAQDASAAKLVSEDRRVPESGAKRLEAAPADRTTSP